MTQSTAPEILVGMPVILAGDCPRAQNLMVVTSCDYRTKYAKVAGVAHNDSRVSEVPLTSLTPLKMFGVLLTANTKLKMFAALPSGGLPNRTAELGEYRKWDPMPNVVTLSYNPNFALIQPQYFVRADENAQE